MPHQTILGIDPGTKEMGFAVLRGRELLAYGVRTLRNGERPYDLIGQARRIVLRAIATHEPQVAAIEAPLMLPTKRAAILSVIAQELRERAKELSLRVLELSPDEVRGAVVRNPRATKIDVAEALVRQGFDQLKGLVPKRPARAALGLRPRDKYWLHMFDALGLAVAAGLRVRCVQTTYLAIQWRVNVSARHCPQVGPLIAPAPPDINLLLDRASRDVHMLVSSPECRLR